MWPLRTLGILFPNPVFHSAAKLLKAPMSALDMPLRGKHGSWAQAYMSVIDYS